MAIAESSFELSAVVVQEHGWPAISHITSNQLISRLAYAIFTYSVPLQPDPDVSLLSLPAGIGCIHACVHMGMHICCGRYVFANKKSHII